MKGTIRKYFLFSYSPTFDFGVCDFFRVFLSSENKVMTYHNWKIGVCHGHQIVPWGDIEAMSMLQRQLDVDVLVTGHTHKFAISSHEGKLFVNPGSATGAYSGLQR
jgi:vacuolar protein sorting-associated protein 29